MMEFSRESKQQKKKSQEKQVMGSYQLRANYDQQVRMRNKILREPGKRFYSPYSKRSSTASNSKKTSTSQNKLANITTTSRQPHNNNSSQNYLKNINLNNNNSINCSHGKADSKQLPPTQPRLQNNSNAVKNIERRNSFMKEVNDTKNRHHDNYNRVRRMSECLQEKTNIVLGQQKQEKLKREVQLKSSQYSGSSKMTAELVKIESRSNSKNTNSSVILQKQRVLEDPILDIDQLLKNDVTSISSYAQEFAKSLRADENLYRVQVDTWQKNQPQITCQMRCILLEWLSEVHMDCFQFMYQDTLFLTINYIDRFLCAHPEVASSKFQLVGITCMHLANKFEDVAPRGVRILAGFTAGTCSEEQIQIAERSIVADLSFRLRPPTIFQFLQRCLLAAYFISQKMYCVSPEQFQQMKNLAIMLAEITVLNLEHYRFKNSVCAAACCYTSMSIILGDCTNIWNRTMVHYSGYDLKHILPAVLLILQTTQQYFRQDFGIFKKYNSSVYHFVAQKLDANTVKQLGSYVQKMHAKICNVEPRKKENQI